ncbi:MAG: glutamine-hydrolyzing GMP synthase [Candidatus Heimdallarchaeota archaeon]
MIIVVDFGSQVAHLISRRIRELHVYSELVPPSISPKEIQELNPCGIILSGGPSSVYISSAPQINPEIFELNIPTLGICYGHQLIAQELGGKVSKGKGEYGETLISKQPIDSKLLKRHAGEETQEIVWMSHSDFVDTSPPGFQTTSISENNYISSMENPSRSIYTLQFHPEVAHTPNGMRILDNFLTLTGCDRDWNLEDFINEKVQEIRQVVGDSKVLMGVSGGVDSTVAAELIRKAIGQKLYCVFLDNGLLRMNEFEEVRTFFDQSEYNFHAYDVSNIFLSRLTDIRDPEEKRRIIGKTFIEVFEEKAKSLGNFDFLGQGTIYPDRIESAQPSSQASVIKTHHNVGGLPEKMALDLLEPLKDLYKDEVRRIGKLLKIPDGLIRRHPFPGPGLAVRVVGEITKDRLQIVRESDQILVEELKKAGLYSSLWQSFTALLSIETVGVMGDARSYQYPVVIRAVESTDGMTANVADVSVSTLKKIASRIANEVEGVNRVFFDLTNKPPATIEYE